LKPLKIHQKTFVESLTKGGIVLESEEIRQMSNRHIQMFMLEFYSRDSSLFATRNPSKQRNALFSSNPGGIAPEQPKSSAPPSQTESGQNELAADPWASAKMKRKLRTSSPPAKRARKHVDSTSVSSLKVEKEVKSCQKQIGSLLTAMDANLKRIVSIENALKATQSRFEQSLGETGKKILSLEKRLAQFDKKWQASQKQNEEKFERLEGRLNVAYQAAQLASVEAKTAREGSSARADLAEKLRLLEAQVAQELALRRSPINAEVGPEPDQRSRSQPQRQDESINEKIRPEMELTSTLGLDQCRRAPGPAIGKSGAKCSNFRVRSTTSAICGPIAKFSDFGTRATITALTGAADNSWSANSVPRFFK
jgi:hypothetical protein